MKVNYFEVAQNVINKIEEARIGFEPQYTGGWKVCRYGGRIGISIVQEYPLISDLKGIEVELKKQSFTYSNSQEALNEATQLLTVILKLFPDEERVSIYKGEKDSCYNYNYHALGSKGGNYIVAYDSYGSDCLRLPSVYSYERIMELVQREKDEKMALKESRKAQFDELYEAVTEKFGNDVAKAICKHKGSVLQDLKETKNSNLSQEIILDAAQRASGYVYCNLLSLIAAKPRTDSVQKVINKAYAWAYLCSVLPVSFCGHFSDAMEAVKVYRSYYLNQPQ